MNTEECTCSTWHSLLERNAVVHPDRTFIHSIDQDKRITFREMNQWCGKFANFLKQRNVKKDDRISLIGPNSIETMIIYFGTLKYGAILNPIFSGESQENLYHIVNLARPALVFYADEMNLFNNKSDPEWIPFSEPYGKDGAQGDLFELIRDQNTEFDDHLGAEHDAAEILYTSGTMSVPKGIIISRDALYFMAEEISERIGLSEQDRVLEYRAYNWASVQLLTILSAMISGNTLFLAKKFSRTKFPQWLKKFQITISSGVPAVFNMLVNEPVDLKQTDVPRLRFVTSSSAPLPTETHLKFEEMYHIKINQMMGMSEAGWMAGNPPGKGKLGSVGVPVKYKEICFLDEEGARCKPGEVGEMVVSGKSMGACYLSEDGTWNEFPKEGFHTGDLGYMDEDGYIFITGRKKDLIIRGGINISPMEISCRLLEHPAVYEAATVGAPCHIYGEEVVSFVSTKEGFNIEQEELIAHCKKSLPDFKTPKKIIFVQTLPRNKNGKVTRSELMRLLEIDDS